ncbi:LLM class F420-dependent oxidoreductase [Streptomyces iconiensis]|uniref:LLM class F420-dependent oxidoreductase n=1 Tax=Streptomyces iconiensis TaxID=1384038 RepID=A0ABT6ZNP7_9ACTN|nr:LLM class F420-dependent oxidoreductase [Streptomyces iconiensis]MDJ1130685.1 LLM class F420-dependent oxidoreductase [Streptomyces iconiensis]
MKFGVSALVTDEGIAPARLGQALEERGFESLFAGEHSHIPVKRETPWPGGGELGRDLYRTLDPFVVLTAAAAVTERLLVGGGVFQVTQRDPLTLAKEIASLDLVSGGRAVAGVGAGWNREEIRNHGVEPRTRMALLRERVLAMKALWTQEQAEFHGDFVSFDPVFSWPKPVQRPHPPVMVGGNHPAAVDRVLDFGDEWGLIWLPMMLEGEASLGDLMSDFRRRADERGRGHIPVTAYQVPVDARAVESITAAGVDRILFTLDTEPEAETLRGLDAMAKLFG